MKLEHIKEIEICITQYQALSKEMDIVYKHPGDNGSFIDTVWEMFDRYTDTVEMLIGDHFNNLSWYMLENDCGKDAMERTVDKKKRKIKTVKDLVWLIEV